jgi:predicted ATPase
MQLELKPINVLIGSNGSGKSNFISFFRMLDAIYNRRLQRYVLEENADNILYFGRKVTEELFGKLIFGVRDVDNNAFWFSIVQDNQGGLFLREEGYGYRVSINDNYHNYFTSHTLKESKISAKSDYRYDYIKSYLKDIQIYHFHDTSSTSMLRRECEVNDNEELNTDGRNLPAFLYYLQERHVKLFGRLVKTIQSIAPYIDEFILKPKKLDPNKIELRWREKADLDTSFGAYQFSDGTLRFIALATVLMQPDPPSVIVIDEPELGLHPLAISKLAGMIQLASKKTQVIISTQSVSLVDCFEPEDIITVDRDEKEQQSIFRRLDLERLNVWLGDHTLGDLWGRNILSAAQPFSK